MHIGRVVGTENRPNTSFKFYFWANPKEPVGIGTLVRVQTDETSEYESQQVFGIVVEAHGFNDLARPLHEYLSMGGDTSRKPPTQRTEMRLYEAAVLRRMPEEPIGAVPIGNVFLADEAGVRAALRTDSYAEDMGIPCGCYGRIEEPLAVHFHRSFLLGPEAGHLNVTGTSGLAAKTSYILFLLQSVFKKQKEGQTTAALLFNTKGSDLMFIDQPAPGAMSDIDLKLYEACEIDPKPFDTVRYFAPRMETFADLATLRRSDQLDAQNPVQPISFGLEAILNNLEVLLDQGDIDAKADGYLQYLRERFVGRKEGSRLIIADPESSEKPRAKNLDDLEAIITEQQDWAMRKQQQFVDSHSVYTINKIRNRLSNLSKRFRGVIDEEGKGEGPLSGPFQSGTVYVIDVSRQQLQAQELIFSAVITELRRKMEEQQLGVSNLIVVVDELNKYAPTTGRDTHVSRSLREIAARGRYLGLTLFGAQQFKSRVDKEIVGNCASHAYGHVEMEELAQPGYTHFSAAVREKLGSLQAGEIMVRHPQFAQPIFLRFPRPSMMNGSEGASRFAPRRELTVMEAIENAYGRYYRNLDGWSKYKDNLSQYEDAKRIGVLKRIQAGEDPRAALRQNKVQRPEELAPVSHAAADGEFNPL